jgi:hypothetical protein
MQGQVGLNKGVARLDQAVIQADLLDHPSGPSQCTDRQGAEHEDLARKGDRVQEPVP